MLKMKKFKLVSGGPWLYPSNTLALSNKLDLNLNLVLYIFNNKAIIPITEVKDLNKINFILDYNTSNIDFIEKINLLEFETPIVQPDGEIL